MYALLQREIALDAERNWPGAGRLTGWGGIRNRPPLLLKQRQKGCAAQCWQNRIMRRDGRTAGDKRARVRRGGKIADRKLRSTAATGDARASLLLRSGCQAVRTAVHSGNWRKPQQKNQHDGLYATQHEIQCSASAGAFLRS